MTAALPVAPAHSVAFLPARRANEPIDPGRITANAAVVCLHAAVAMLLLAPVALPDWQPPASPSQTIEWIRRAPPPPVEPPPLPATPRTTPATAAPPVASPAAPRAPAVVAEPAQPDTGDPPADTSLAEAFDPASGSSPLLQDIPAAPPSGVTLQYAHAPAPRYPPAALREGRSGLVVLEVLVDTDGRPLEVTVARSSGHRDLDRAAQRQVQEAWRFRPALHGGVPVRAVGLVPVEFSPAR